MFRLLVSMVMMLSASLAATAAAAECPAILILGDSLSAAYGISREASWPHLLESRLHEQGYRHSVVNASISGETTAGGARRLAGLLAEHEPALVLLALGANDGLRGLPVAETRKNLVHMINIAVEARARVVLIKVRIPPNYGSRYSAGFEALFDELGTWPEVDYAPFMLEAFATDANAFQADGLHPTAESQAQILDTLWPSINHALAGILATAAER